MSFTLAARRRAERTAHRSARPVRPAPGLSVLWARYHRMNAAADARERRGRSVSAVVDRTEVLVAEALDRVRGAS